MAFKIQYHEDALALGPSMLYRALTPSVFHRVDVACFQWTIPTSKALRGHGLKLCEVTRPIGGMKDAVAQFHEIVTALEEAYAVDLSAFRIPDAEVKPRIVGVSPAPRSGRFPARRQMSDRRYCDEQFALRQMEGIVFYFQSLQPSQAG
jgi:hypothetical protein